MANTAQREELVRAMLAKKQAEALSSAVPVAPSVSSAAEGLFGMDPMIDRLNLLPRWSREEGLVAPQVVYQAARALVSPGVAAQGGRVSPEDAVNFAGNVSLGGIGASRALPPQGPGKTVGMAVADKKGRNIHTFTLGDKKKVSEFPDKVVTVEAWSKDGSLLAQDEFFKGDALKEAETWFNDPKFNPHYVKVGDSSGNQIAGLTRITPDRKK